MHCADKREVGFFLCPRSGQVAAVISPDPWDPGSFPLVFYHWALALALASLLRGSPLGMAVVSLAEEGGSPWGGVT